MIQPYKPLYTVKEASELLLMNTDSLYALIKKGDLTALKLGALKVRGTDLEKFIEKYPAYSPSQIDNSTTEN